jgi:hypothetical protein
VANQVQICNLALSRLGANLIQSLDDTSNEAIVCNNLYAFALAIVLRDHDWSFCRKWQNGALLTETHPEWNYVYRYPSDCAMVRRIGNQFTMKPRDAIPFDIGQSVTGNFQVALCNEPAAILIYTAQVSNTAVFDTIFCDALAWRLAAEMAQPLRAETQLSESVGNRYLQVLQDAKAKSANEKKVEPDSGGSFTDFREGNLRTGVNNGVPWYALPSGDEGD